MSRALVLAPGPWNTRHDGHGGIYVGDAQDRQIGFVSLRLEQEDHADLFRIAPLLWEHYQAYRLLLGTLGHPEATAEDESAAEKAFEKAERDLEQALKDAGGLV